MREEDAHYSTHNAIGNGHYEALHDVPRTARTRNRNSTPPPRNRRQRSPSPMIQEATPKIHHEHSYGTVDEWLQHFKNKTQLSEEIYKRDKWKQYIGAKDSIELRQKLKGKSLSELAQILVRLDHM